MAKKSTKKYGHYAYIVGVLLAILAAFIAIPQSALILVILGVIVGFVNITVKETDEFLIATVALVVAGIAASGFATIPLIGSYLADMLTNIVILVAPAAVIVALKAIKVTAEK